LPDLPVPHTEAGGADIGGKIGGAGAHQAFRYSGTRLPGSANRCRSTLRLQRRPAVSWLRQLCPRLRDPKVQAARFLRKIGPAACRPEELKAAGRSRLLDITGPKASSAAAAAATRRAPPGPKTPVSSLAAFKAKRFAGNCTRRCRLPLNPGPEGPLEPVGLKPVWAETQDLPRSLASRPKSKRHQQ